ncbi:MAG: hypothetical protein BGO67_11635 [Alphaproteobacteria bacterium 41-28]|nr:MAG: hypothetical protein BGO67_11635 [Alphaproteobacteria bacterium 41-28]
MKKFSRFKTKFIAYTLILLLVSNSFPLHAMQSDSDLEIWSNGTNHVRFTCPPCKCDSPDWWQIYGYPLLVGFTTTIAGVVCEKFCRISPRLINCCEKLNWCKRGSTTETTKKKKHKEKTDSESSSDSEAEDNQIDSRANKPSLFTGEKKHKKSRPNRENRIRRIEKKRKEEAENNPESSEGDADVPNFFSPKPKGVFPGAVDVPRERPADINDGINLPQNKDDKVSKETKPLTKTKSKKASPNHRKKPRQEEIGKEEKRLKAEEDENRKKKNIGSSEDVPNLFSLKSKKASPNRRKKSHQQEVDKEEKRLEAEEDERLRREEQQKQQKILQKKKAEEEVRFKKAQEQFRKKKDIGSSENNTPNVLSLSKKTPPNREEKPQEEVVININDEAHDKPSSEQQ